MPISGIEKRLENFETALPGVVKNVNSDGTVDVSLSIRKVSLNGVVDIAAMPILSVPLLTIGTRAFSFKLPVKTGDPVLLLAISRDSSLWKVGDWGEKDVVPKSCSGNTLCDFVALQMNFWRTDTSNGAEITEEGKVVINADVEINGAVTVAKELNADSVKATGNVEAGDVISNGDVSATGDLKTASLSFLTHVHNCTSPGSPSGPAISPAPTSTTPETP